MGDFIKNEDSNIKDYINEKINKSIRNFVIDNEDNEFNKNSLEKLKIVHLHGWLSKVFGTNDYIHIHIAGTISILLVIAGIIISFTFDNFKEHWDIFLPVITMCVGYIFGKNSNK